MDLFLLKILFLALPGLVGGKVYRDLRGKREKKNWEDIFDILLFSILSYVVLGLIDSLISVFWTAYIPSDFLIFNIVLDENTSVPWVQVAAASLLAGVIAFPLSAMRRYRVISTIGRKLKVTNKTSEDEEVWDYFWEVLKPGWVHVRDHQHDLIYFGWIKNYSDVKGYRELVLEDVGVYKEGKGDMQPIYNLDSIYICRERDQISVEVGQKSIDHTHLETVVTQTPNGDHSDERPEQAN